MSKSISRDDLMALKRDLVTKFLAEQSALVDDFIYKRSKSYAGYKEGLYGDSSIKFTVGYTNNMQAGKLTDAAQFSQFSPQENEGKYEPTKEDAAKFVKENARLTTKSIPTVKLSDSLQERYKAILEEGDKKGGFVYDKSGGSDVAENFFRKRNKQNLMVIDNEDDPENLLLYIRNILVSIESYQEEESPLDELDHCVNRLIKLSPELQAGIVGENGLVSEDYFELYYDNDLDAQKNVIAQQNERLGEVEEDFDDVVPKPNEAVVKFKEEKKKQRIDTSKKGPKEPVTGTLDVQPIIKKPKTEEKDMTKPAPAPYEYIDFEDSNKNKFGLRVGAVKKDGAVVGYFPIVVKRQDDGAYLEPMTQPAAVEEGIYDVPDGENLLRSYIAKGLSSMVQEKDGYMLSTTETNFDFNKHLAALAKGDGGRTRLALEWTSLHARIMETEQRLKENAQQIKAINDEKVALKNTVGFKVEPGKGQTHALIDSAPGAPYSEVLDSTVEDTTDKTKKAADKAAVNEELKRKQEELKAQLAVIEAKKQPILEEGKRLEGVKKTLEQQSKDCKEALETLDPRAFGTPVYLDFVEDENAVSLLLGDTEEDMYVDVPLAGSGSVPPKVATTASLQASAASGAKSVRPPATAPRLEDIKGTKGFQLFGLPGSTEGKTYSLNLSYDDSSFDMEISSYRQKVRTAPVSVPVVDKDYRNNVLAPFFATRALDAETAGLESADVDGLDAASIDALVPEVATAEEVTGAAATTSIDSGVPVLFEPQNEGIYLATADKYKYNFAEAVKRINNIDAQEDDQLAKATLVAYIIDLNSNIDAINSRAEPTYDEAKKTAQTKQELVDGFKGVFEALTAKAEEVFDKKDIELKGQDAEPPVVTKSGVRSVASGKAATSPSTPKASDEVSKPGLLRRFLRFVGAAPAVSSAASSGPAVPPPPPPPPPVSVAASSSGLVLPSIPVAPAGSSAASSGPAAPPPPPPPPPVSGGASLAASSATPPEPSITPFPITNFKPKVSAKKEFPAAKVDGEEFLNTKVVDKARNHSAQMAYLAVNNPAAAVKEVGSYISQNYQDLLDCHILAPYVAKTKIKDFDPKNDEHKKAVVAAASKEISQFVGLCKTYDPADANPAFEDFRKKIGLVQDRANPTEHRITWVANDVVSDKPVATAGDITKGEQFFWQRTFLAAQRAQFLEDEKLSPTIEKDKKDNTKEIARRDKIKEKLLLRNSSENPLDDDEANNAGLAQTGKDGLLTADGLEKHMAFYEAQDSQSAGQETPFDIFSYLPYEGFAELSGKLAAINADDIEDIDEANEAIIKAGLEDLFGGYFEFGGDSRTDTRSRSLLPMLWMLKEHTAQKDANGDIFSKTFADLKKKAQDATKTPAERDAAKASMKATAKALIDDLIGQSPADLQELYGKAKDGVKDKVLFRSDDDEASYLYKMLSEKEDEKDIFEEAKQKLKERREKTPPRADEVLAARKRMAETLSAMPDKWTKDKQGNVVNKVPVLVAAALAPILKADPSDAEKAAYKVELDAYNAANPTQAERDAHKQAVANYYANLHLTNYEFKKPDEFELSKFEESKKITADQLQTYLDNGENAVGDEGLFADPAKSEAFLRSGFLIAEFNKPSCLYDLAAAVDEMPSGALKGKIEKGQTIYSLAYLSGDDGIQRDNKYALISQSKRGTVTNFTTSAIVEQEIFSKNAKFYEENHQYEARIDSLQQAADLSLVYLQDFIAVEFRRKDATGKSVYAEMKDVMKSPKVIALTDHNKDLNVLLREFGSNENDSVEKRRDKMDRLRDFVSSDKPNLNPPYLTTDAKSLEAILKGLEAAMVKDSSAAKKLVSLGGDIKTASHRSPTIEAKARKHGQAEMQNYLHEKDQVAQLESKLKLHLDDKDIKVIEDDYYRGNNIRPDFTKGGKSDLKKLLSAEIPGSSVPGFAIYKPKPGEDGYVRYGSSAKNPSGKANTAIININIPGDPVLAADMDDTCWVYLPGTPECYVKISVDLQTGKTTIHPEIYHKNKGQGYDSIGSTKKSLIAALGEIDGAKVYQSHQNFNVLAVSSIGGVRAGVSAKFNGNPINKTQEEIKSRATSAATMNKASPAQKMECKFAIDDKKRVMQDGPSLKLLAALSDDAAVLRSKYKIPFEDEAKYIADNLSKQNFTINGKTITVIPPIGGGSDKVTGIEFIYAVDLPGEVGGKKTYSKKSMRLDPPKVVLTYENSKGEKQEPLIFDADPENMKKMLGRDAKEGFQKLLDDAKTKEVEGAEIVAANSVTLIDGIHLPKSFGDMTPGIDENKVRIVLPVMTIKGDKHDSLAFHAPVIQYYKYESEIPHYMAFNQENFAKLYTDELLQSTFDSLAARVDVQVDNTRVPVVFEHRDAKGDVITQVQLEVKSFIDSDLAIKLNLEKGKAPDSTCEVISAELVKGQVLDLNKGATRGGAGAGK